MSDRDLTHLHPHVFQLLNEHVTRAQAHGLLVVVIETYRNEAEQLANWQKGRDASGNIVDPGSIVTMAKPGDSYHGVCYPNGTPCSLAYHLAIDVPGPPLLGFGDSRLDTAAEALYTGLGILGEELGLTWGGRWHQPRDWTHFELRVPGKSLTDLKLMIKTLGDIDSLFQRKV